MAHFLPNELFGNGSDGALAISSSQTDGAPNTSIVGSSGSQAATFGSGSGFANGNMVLIVQSQTASSPGGWELNAILSGGGTTSPTMKYALANAYSAGAQVYLLKQYSSVSIQGGATVQSTTTWRQSANLYGGIVAYLARDSITIGGTIDQSNRGFLGDNAAGISGEGSTGAVNSGYPNGGGGQGTNGGATNNSGAGGGYAASGSNGTGTSGGGSYGNADLSTLFFGSGGGGGQAIGGDGGGGAGAIILIAPIITLTGGLNANGIVGNNAVGNGGGGGGGAGGSILFVGRNITLGSNLATATGAAGGSGKNGGATGGTGSNGRIAVYGINSALVSGTTNPAYTFVLNTDLRDTSGGGII